MIILIKNLALITGKILTIKKTSSAIIGINKLIIIGTKTIKMKAMINGKGVIITNKINISTIGTIPRDKATTIGIILGTKMTKIIAGITTTSYSMISKKIGTINRVSITGIMMTAPSTIKGRELLRNKIRTMTKTTNQIGGNMITTEATMTTLEAIMITIEETIAAINKEAGTIINHGEIINNKATLETMIETIVDLVIIIEAAVRVQ